MSQGSSILRMLHSWIGNDNFRKGMKSYLIKYNYSNTVTEQLWAELEQASGLPVTAVMKNWTIKMGFPLVEAEIEECGTDWTKVKLTQSKFSASGNF